MKVFDLSEFQPDDRVYTLAEHYGADGVILKLGETINGTPDVDPKFVTFVNDAIENKLPYGIYYVSHARTMDDFMQEANWMNDTMYDLLGGIFPPLGIWWDMEVPSVCRDDVWPQLRDVIGTQQSWYDANKDKIGIYAGYSYFNQYCDMNELAYYAIPVWVAQYGYHENSLKAEHPELKHAGWQYADSYEGMSQDVSEWYGFKG